MRRILFYIIFLLLAVPFGVSAQMGKAYDMMVNGVKVIVQPSGNDIVVIQTAIKGGVQNYAADKTGIESIARHRFLARQVFAGHAARRWFAGRRSEAFARTQSRGGQRKLKSISSEHLK